MFSVPDFLDRAKKAAGVTTDYALARKVLGHKSQANVSNWRNEKTIPDDDSVMALCKLTGDDPEDVAVRLQSMRAANDDTADLWRRIADRLKRQGGASSLSILLAVAMLLGASFTEPVQAAPTLLQDAGLALRIMSTQVQKLGLVGSARHPDWLSHD